MKQTKIFACKPTPSLLAHWQRVSLLNMGCVMWVQVLLSSKFLIYLFLDFFIVFFYKGTNFITFNVLTCTYELLGTYLSYVFTHALFTSLLLKPTISHIHFNSSKWLGQLSGFP